MLTAQVVVARQRGRTIAAQRRRVALSVIRNHRLSSHKHIGVETALTHTNTQVVDRVVCTLRKLR